MLISGRKPQFTQKHLSPFQIHDHNKEKVTKLYCKVRPPKGIRNDQLAYYMFTE